MEKMSKFISPKKKLFIKCLQNRRYTCSMYEQSLCSLKIREEQITQTRTPRRIWNGKKCLSSTALKRYYISNVHKIGCAHVQFVNNHYAKFECKGMKIIGVTDYTYQTPKAFWVEIKCLSSTPLKTKKVFIKCAQNGRCTFDIITQSLCV